VAVIGASERQGSIGNALMKNIQKGNYPGALFPINPKYTTLNGLKSYPSITDVGQPIDLAVIATPMEHRAHHHWEMCKGCK
jgi:acetyltransferase